MNETEHTEEFINVTTMYQVRGIFWGLRDVEGESQIDMFLLNAIFTAFLSAGHRRAGEE